MKCPFCGLLETQVMDSRVGDDGSSVRRRRRCLSCDKRFTTFEVADVRMPQVVKSNGHRADFAEEKVRVSFARALHKRPVPANKIEDAIAHITQSLLLLGDREVSSRLIGEMVMHELALLDKVAYVRFASVYKSFQDVAEFTATIRQIENAHVNITKSEEIKK